MASNEVVLAFFNNEDAADDAVEALKAWDKANEDVKLTSIGVMVLDDKGQLKTHKMGSRSAMKGAGVGLVAAVDLPAVPARRHRRRRAARFPPSQEPGSQRRRPQPDRG